MKYTKTNDDQRTESDRVDHDGGNNTIAQEELTQSKDCQVGYCDCSESSHGSSGIVIEEAPTPYGQSDYILVAVREEAGLPDIVPRFWKAAVTCLVLFSSIQLNQPETPRVTMPKSHVNDFNSENTNGSRDMMIAQIFGLVEMADMFKGKRMCWQRCIVIRRRITTTPNL